MKKLKIIMTGGGSAGHVTPNLALIPKLKKLGYEVQYIGTYNGIERGIIEKENIPYHCISSGKLRRYFDLKNFSDPFRVIKGLVEAVGIIRREKPNIVFSKGGFVAVPVVIGAYLNKVPVIAHESDLTPGLANRISASFCSKICVTFPETVDHMKKGKAVLTGTPIRKELLEGKKEKGLELCGFHNGKPVIAVMGGSLGAKYINTVIRECLPSLLQQHNIIHICGKGNLESALTNKAGYAQFEYVNEELPHLFAAADIVISRAGANAIFELLALKKPNILIPLSAKSSRGDQILNAASFKKAGYSMVIQEEMLTVQSLIKAITELKENQNEYIKAMNESKIKNGVDAIVELLQKNTLS